MQEKNLYYSKIKKKILYSYAPGLKLQTAHRKYNKCLDLIQNFINL